MDEKAMARRILLLYGRLYNVSIPEYWKALRQRQAEQFAEDRKITDEDSGNIAFYLGVYTGLGGDPKDIEEAA